MQKIITRDETWVYQYDPETKRQSSQWIERGEPKPKRARFTKSKVKTLLVTFFYINSLVHHEFIPFGRTINQEVYLVIMRRLREAVRSKRPERWQNNDWILYVDNARPHTAHVVLQFLAKHSTIQIPHPPYSPDLAPNDFFLYPKLKMKLKGRKFDNVDMIQAESKATLRNLSKSDFISCFDNWKKKMEQIMPCRCQQRNFQYTDDFTRGVVIRLKRADGFIRQIAADTHLGVSTVHRLWRRWLEKGNEAIYRNVGAEPELLQHAWIGVSFDKQWRTLIQLVPPF
ncbi:hypothetical protein LAZ67_7001367 [Cordylochernes scorpioides]|uniref:Transposase n=1 Tax=Cordylochernes scorpioides TaxID=51811 RepID=A0ABY6KQ58_9ARAC|nr:hypothetical protein LAZ67_7001367 [Cordylochernes scorpioides]